MQSFSVIIERVVERTLKFTSWNKNSNGEPDYEATCKRITHEE